MFDSWSGPSSLSYGRLQPCCCARGFALHSAKTIVFAGSQSATEPLRALLCSVQIPSVLKSCSIFVRGGLSYSNSHDQVTADDDGFPVKSVPSRFFWVCGECAKTHSIKQWTPAGLVLEAHAVKVAPRACS